jgi:hypothetical protein
MDCTLAALGCILLSYEQRQNVWGLQDRQVSQQERLEGQVERSTDLWVAVEAADIQLVTALLQQFPEKAREARCTDGFTPLHAAAAVHATTHRTDHRLATIMTLLVQLPPTELAANVHAQDSSGNTPMDSLLMHELGSAISFRYMALARATGVGQPAPRSRP